VRYFETRFPLFRWKTNETKKNHSTTDFLTENRKYGLVEHKAWCDSCRKYATLLYRPISRCWCSRRLLVVRVAPCLLHFWIKRLVFVIASHNHANIQSVHLKAQPAPTCCFVGECMNHTRNYRHAFGYMEILEAQSHYQQVSRRVWVQKLCLTDVDFYFYSWIWNAVYHTFLRCDLLLLLLLFTMNMKPSVTQTVCIVETYIKEKSYKKGNRMWK
jgi:hypothetical protein